MNFVSNLAQAAQYRGKSSDYTLLTGSTGLLGRYLLRDLLSTGERVAVLVRNSAKADAIDRIESVMQFWEQKDGHPLPRPVVLAGDVTLPNLGLSIDDRRWIGNHVVRILHSAAMIRFDTDVASGEPARTNLVGIRNILELMRNSRIQDIHHVSTAYVCGKRQTLIRESDLDCDQGFHNAYEESKFQAECEIRAATDILHRTIYRPTIITADSQTGYTNTYFGIMWYLKLLAVLVPQQPVDANGIRQTPIEMPVSGDEPHNLVPVDWVSAVITKLIGNPAARGQTFHLASPHSVTMREVLDVCYEHFCSQGVRFVGGDGQPHNEDSPFAKSFLESSSNYRDYDVFTPQFDRTNLERLVGQIPCPKIDAEMVRRFLKFGVEDRWGKRKSQQVSEPGQPVPAALKAMLSEHQTGPLQKLINGYKQGLGVDLVGPGGGQWRLVPGQREVDGWVLERGLGHPGLPVKSLTVGQFNDHLCDG